MRYAVSVRITSSDQQAPWRLLPGLSDISAMFDLDQLVNFLDEWQTLVGAIVGGVFALLVALLVAYKARRREEIAAAMLLVGDLVSFISANKVLRQLVAEVLYFSDRVNSLVCANKRYALALRS